MVTAQIVEAGNFTPPSRTPWGGKRIVSKYKAGLALDVDLHARVGESWEISIEPSFPSLLATGQPLAEAIAQDPAGWLGAHVSARYGQNPLLVKLVDAATTLSVQVHPPEDHAILEAEESGKTEAWIVLDADPEAIVYLGFRDGVTRETVEVHLQEGRSLEPLMNHVPVKPGDVFVIRPGTVHALGAGMTVLEPQRVLPGRRSVTYRFWDWDRRYNANGEPDARGEPRPLHIREGLAVTDWAGPRGDAMVRACWRAPIAIESSPQFTRARLVDEPELFVEDWQGSATSILPNTGSMLGVLCLEGRGSLSWPGHALTLRAGQTAVVPAAAPEILLSMEKSRVALCAVPA